MSVGRTLTLRNKLITDLELCRYIGTRPVGDQFHDFVRTVCSKLPKAIQHRAVHESLLSWAGSELTDELLQKLCWRLAGNIDQLKVGQIVPMNGELRAEAWCPVQFTSAVLERDRKGRICSRLRYLVLSGPLCSESGSELLTRQFMHYIAKDMGFTRPRNGMPFEHPRQFVNLRAELLLQPRSDNNTGRTKFQVTSAGLTWNKQLLKSRQRLPGGYKCPEDYNVTVHCHLCPIGYKNCLAATHKTDYVKDVCPRCGQPAYFDRNISSEICLACHELSQFQRKEVQNV